MKEDIIKNLNENNYEKKKILDLIKDKDTEINVKLNILSVIKNNNKYNYLKDDKEFIDIIINNDNVDLKEYVYKNNIFSDQNKNIYEINFIDNIKNSKDIDNIIKLGIDINKYNIYIFENIYLKLDEESKLKLIKNCKLDVNIYINKKLEKSIKNNDMQLYEYIKNYKNIDINKLNLDKITLYYATKYNKNEIIERVLISNKYIDEKFINYIAYNKGLKNILKIYKDIRNDNIYESTNKQEEKIIEKKNENTENKIVTRTKKRGIER